MIKTLRSSLSSLLGFESKGAAPHPEDIRRQLEEDYTPKQEFTRIAAVYSCNRVLSETMGQLPLILYRRKERGKERAEDRVEYNLLRHKPNDYQSAFSFKEMLVAHVNYRGNFYSQIVSSRRRVLQMVPLHPDRMEPEIKTDGSINYRYTTKRGIVTNFDPEDILHIPGPAFDADNPLKGVTPLAAVSDTFDLAREAQLFAKNTFKNGGSSTLVFNHPGKIKPESKQAMRKDWEEHHAGQRNAGRPIILDEGLEAKALNMTLKDAQFIESRKMSRSEICGIFRVPPHMISDLERATFSNIEHQGLSFIQFTMMPWITRVEEALTSKLFLPYSDTQDLFVEVLVTSILRGDQKSRYEAYKSGIETGWLIRNEARELENMNPVEGLDEPLLPLNMVTEEERRAKLEAEIAATERDASGEDGPPDDDQDD